PISSKLVIAAYCQSIMSDLAAALEGMESAIRGYSASIFRKGLAVRRVMEAVEARQHWNDAHAKYTVLASERLMPIDTDMLAFLNSLQIRWEYRQIASETG